MATMSLEMIEEIRDVARAYAEGEHQRYERLRAAQVQPAPAQRVRAPRRAAAAVHAD